MLQKYLHLFQPEESDIYLTIGVVALFIGISLIYYPAALIFIGLVFIGLSYLEEKKAVANGIS